MSHGFAATAATSLVLAAVFRRPLPRQQVVGDVARDRREALPVVAADVDPGGTPPLVRLKAVCGPGDQGEPVLTVMRPDED
jgi:hypothetical protein